MAMTWFEHEVKRELTGQLDQSVVPSFGDDEDALDIGAYPGTACTG